MTTKAAKVLKQELEDAKIEFDKLLAENAQLVKQLQLHLKQLHYLATAKFFKALRSFWNLRKLYRETNENKNVG